MTAVKRGDSANSLSSFTTKAITDAHISHANHAPSSDCRMGREWRGVGWPQHVAVQRSPSVKFGGVAVGGIRISHMTDIGNGISMATNASKGKKKEVIIQPLKAQAPSKPAISDDQWPQSSGGRKQQKDGAVHPRQVRTDRRARQRTSRDYCPVTGGTKENIMTNLTTPPSPP